MHLSLTSCTSRLQEDESSTEPLATHRFRTEVPGPHHAEQPSRYQPVNVPS